MHPFLTTELIRLEQAALSRRLRRRARHRVEVRPARTTRVR
ncbi:hypothetical protein AB0H57_13635 [Micromonospora sp. NPDC050686]